MGHHRRRVEHGGGNRRPRHTGIWPARALPLLVAALLWSPAQAAPVSRSLLEPTLHNLVPTECADTPVLE